MKTLNSLSFTYNFSFYPPSSQRLLHFLKKGIEDLHFFKPKGLLSYFWIQFDLIHFEFILILVLSILFWTILGVKHANYLGLPLKNLFDNVENMYVPESDSKYNVIDYWGWTIHKKMFMLTNKLNVNTSFTIRKQKHQRSGTIKSVILVICQ